MCFTVCVCVCVYMQRHVVCHILHILFTLPVKQDAMVNDLQRIKTSKLLVNRHNIFMCVQFFMELWSALHRIALALLQ